MTDAEKQRALISLAAFLKRNGPSYRHVQRERLLDVVGWYWRHGLIGVVRERGRIVACALARCVNTLEEAAQPYVHDEAAPIVWVDEIACRHPLGVPLLFRQVLQRFGPRQSFAGTVFNRDGELRMLPMKAVERLIQGTPQHEQPEHSRATCAA